MTSNIRTREVQEVILDIMKEIHKICVDNGLKYYLSAGSALGAIRHDGFIPWDDDLDILMPRSDYVKFLNIAKEKLPNNLYIQFPENERKCHVLFAKVRKRNTLFDEKICQGNDYPKGIYVDIFPLDNVKKCNLLFKLKYRIFRFYKSMFLMHTRTDKLDFKHRIGKALSFFFPRLHDYKVINRLMIYNKASKYCIDSFSAYNLNKIVYRKEIFGEPQLHVFEDTSFYIPEQVDEYLKILYGDYMKLPPVEERGKRHDVVEISFDYDDSKYFKEDK